MGWVDRHRRHGAVLALIALALQIAVAFGHVHLRTVAQNPHATSVRTALADTRSHSPTQNRGDDDDYCAVCASIFLASSAFAPPPPQLPLPATFERVEHSFNAASTIVESPRLAFRSRAPPAA
jgi:DUF2946 family protein